MAEEVKSEGAFKVKKKPGRPKKLNKKEEPVKVDLSKKEEETKQDAVQEQTTDEVLVRDEPKVSEEVSKENIEETTEKPTEESKEEEVTVISPISEVTEEEVKEVKQEFVAQEPVVEQRQLPENIEKLVAFMEETGGTVEDYVRINADYSDVDNPLLKNIIKELSHI